MGSIRQSRCGHVDARHVPGPVILKVGQDIIQPALHRKWREHHGNVVLPGEELQIHPGAALYRARCHQGIRVSQDGSDHGFGRLGPGNDLGRKLPQEGVQSFVARDDENLKVARGTSAFFPKSQPAPPEPRFRIPDPNTDRPCRLPRSGSSAVARPISKIRPGTSYRIRKSRSRLTPCASSSPVE